jgi:hypothetical protein
MMRIMQLLTLAASICAAAAAQTFPEPPPLVRVIRTTVPDPAAAARYNGAGALAVFGMSAVTGAAEWWTVEAHASFAAMEQTERALRPLGAARGLTGEPVAAGPASTPTSWLGVYRPWLSYRPLEASQMLGKTCYFQVLVFQIEPEEEADFVEAVRARKVSLDGMNLDRPEMAYQVISGAPTITYVFLDPLASLTSFDEVLARLPHYARPAAKVAAGGNLSHRNLLFRVEPAMSVVPDDIAERAPEFWRPGGQR